MAKKSDFGFTRPPSSANEAFPSFLAAACSTSCIVAFPGTVTLTSAVPVALRQTCTSTAARPPFTATSSAQRSLPPG
eukprot:CAMPEP_0168481388 /NCGR_PEP_ID=MMETSP0228-20121227/64487_1 /TAXON_ID=133427 /ORGANISM="Protoceratium reticulatum, Strain CCCM 535 (=CCMP 1889)" /LENGTH=76 /DNA_ID=CAMNT_0008497757 /DNA_START=37 /DNA_END=263 /DNA_ORIENTATION=-